MGQKSDRAREVGKPDISNNADLVKPSFLIFLLFLFFFEQTSPFTPKSGLNCSVYLCFDDHGSFRNLSVGFSPTQTSLRSVLRPRLLVRTPFRERDAHSSSRRSTSHHVRYRAVPRTNRTLTTTNTHIHSATSSTSELPTGAPSQPSLCSCADASPGACTGVASAG